MKKISLAILAVFVMLVVPNHVDAASSVEIKVSCSDVAVGGTSTCVITGISDSFSAIDIRNLSLSSEATMIDMTAGSGFFPLDNTISGASGSLLYGTSYDKSGSFTIATITVKGLERGQATLKLSDIYVSIDNCTVDAKLDDIETTFNVY